MNGISAVQARIAAVQSRFEATAAQLEGRAAPADAAPDGDFAAVLAAALGGNGADALGASGTASGGAAALGGPGGTGALPGLAGLLSRTGTPGAAGGASGVGGVGAVGARPTAAGTGIVAAERKAPGAYGRLQPPAELQRFGNGRIPAEALEPIGVGNHRLWAPAARSFQAMKADAAAAGVEIGITDSYRDHATQVSLARRKGLYSQGGLAATPGTSNHGWGMAVDLDLDSKGLAWMRENGWRYGFVEDTPREPWHWGFRPANRP